MFFIALDSVEYVGLEKTMEEALQMVMVARDIHDALTLGKGPYAALYEFMKEYETANWQEVSRQLLLAEINLDDVNNAYADALKWYKQLV